MNGLRLLLAARKSRKSEDADTQYERQDFRARQWAERQGNVIVHATADVKSSQTPPWTRKDLGPWMRDALKLAMYDAILISDTDRLSRGTDEDFHYIEDWCYRNGKRIVVADGPQFPPREGPMGDSDRYQWIAQKRAARTYWEAVRDKHADTREVIKANGGAIGYPPFGYKVEGPKLRKTFVIDPVAGPLVREAFQRIADGRTTTSVAIWLSEVAPRPRTKNGSWTVTVVTSMIKRRTYLGKREGFEFQPIVSQELWDNANAALEGRGGVRASAGRRTGHGYSGLIYCECGSKLYRHHNGRGERYRCGRGRLGSSEAKCGYPSLLFSKVNAAVDALMSDDMSDEYVMVTTGGDHDKQAHLAEIREAMNAAMAKGDMAALTRLAADYAKVDARPSERIKTEPKKTGRRNGDVWRNGTLSDRRSVLEGRQGVHYVTAYTRDGEVKARLDEAEDFPPYTPTE